MASAGWGQLDDAAAVASLHSYTPALPTFACNSVSLQLDSLLARIKCCRDSMLQELIRCTTSFRPKCVVVERRGGRGAFGVKQGQ
jgi:hypothetical protein